MIFPPDTETVDDETVPKIVNSMYGETLKGDAHWKGFARGAMILRYIVQLVRERFT